MTYKWFTSKFKKTRQPVDKTVDSRPREPLEHPELSRMTLAELADLPMPSFTNGN